MKRIFTTVFLMLFVVSFSYSQVRIATAYNYPEKDSVLSGLKSIRGMAYHPDPFNTGKSAIALTNYNLNGFVHVFVTVGNDSIQLVWSSPRLTTGSGISTPRYAVFGDLDNDGLVEVIYQSNNSGIFIYEWDGVAGSYNFGTQPSQVIATPPIAGLAGYCEYMEVLDVDGDNQNELLVAYNGTPNANDRFYVISATGDWSTNNPGFSGFNLEAEFIRTDLDKWGIGGGSPYAMISAQLDGAGGREIILHNWNFKNVVPVRVSAPDTYLISDTTGGKQNYFLSAPVDDVALFSGLAYDIDGDGREEVYLPTYFSPDTTNAGIVDMIHYEPGQSLSQIDASNVVKLSTYNVTKLGVGFGIGYGDLDGNGKKNLYVSSVYPYNVASMEFQGGDKTNTSNWVMSLLYAGEKDIYNSYTVKDSLGKVDTTFSINTAFASKIWAKDTDFDKDGKQDILLPYQALNDSITVTRYVYNSSTGKFDTTITTIQNPKRWGFRILESTVGTGIEVKELTVITPEDFVLDQNYPNPFNPSTTIRFHLPIDKKISLTVYDILGNEVKTLLNNQDFAKGVYEVEWDGTNNFGSKAASGHYIAELKFGNFSKTIKMSLLK